MRKEGNKHISYIQILGYILFSFTILGLCFIETSFGASATDPFGINDIDTDLKASESNIETIITNALTYILSFLALLAVIFGIWGGVMILTSAGDDERVKRGWRIIFYMVGGVIVIFLAGPLVKWLVSSILV